jgi:DNA-binding CsgD family transcriptional regulator
MINRAIGALEPREEIVCWFRAEGWTSPEIAAKLSISPDSAQQIFTRTRAKTRNGDRAKTVR